MFRGVINSNGIPIKTDSKLTFPHHKTWPDSPLKRLGLLSGGFNGIKYNLNSRGYRCDEFINVHNKKHILFSGCSITAGHSIDIENSWSFLLHNYINVEELRACTTCNACVEECPVSISPLDIILELRRSLIMEESNAPQEWNSMFSNIENNFAPWKFAPDQRDAWTHQA